MLFCCFVLWNQKLSLSAIRYCSHSFCSLIFLLLSNQSLGRKLSLVKKFTHSILKIISQVFLIEIYKTFDSSMLLCCARQFHVVLVSHSRSRVVCWLIFAKPCLLSPGPLSTTTHLTASQLCQSLNMYVFSPSFSYPYLRLYVQLMHKWPQTTTLHTLIKARLIWSSCDRLHTSLKCIEGTYE